MRKKPYAAHCLSHKNKHACNYFHRDTVVDHNTDKRCISDKYFYCYFFSFVKRYWNKYLYKNPNGHAARNIYTDRDDHPYNHWH